jgi:hypothetical protein
MKRLFTDSHAPGQRRKNSRRPSRAPHVRIAAFAFLVLCMSVIALVNVVPVPAQHGRDWRAAEARRKRDFQACMRKWETAWHRALKDAEHKQQLAERKAEDDYKTALHNAKSDAERAAAKKTKMEAFKQAEIGIRKARRDAQEILQAGRESCNNPKPPETPNNNSSNNNPNKPKDSSARGCGGGNSTEGTLGHAPRNGNPSVRMDLRVVDETGKPVRGVKTKLWSERQSNGLLCETIHTTGECGNVLMDPIHITKTLQLKLEAKGFEPQMIQVDPSQLDRPFKAVMQAK